MRLLTVTLLAVVLASAAHADEKQVSFEKDVLPIFKASCLSCHKADKKKGKLDMSTYADLMKGGKQGNPIKPGDPAKSLIIEMISGKEPEMPEKGDKLTDAQVQIIATWIKQGAKP
ncbi:MAG TPA: c-type cytochrome domain-containing protein [Planctomycetota bacterium]|nr:c-type cytochrome domain-containing protein [Planctomycetota bacterium]